LKQMPPSASSFALAVTLGQDSFSASGKHDLVLKAYEDFKAMTGRGGVPAPASATGKTGKAGASTKQPATGSTTTTADGLPLQGYLAELDLPTNWQRVTAILIWSADHGGKGSLTTGEVKKLWAKTHFKSPGNLSRDIGVAAKNGWIMTEGKAHFAHGFGRKAASEWVAKKE
jgi:hypothetical protein